MGRLNDKIAIVTGAGQGIGKAIAGKLAAEGALVVVTDVNDAWAQWTAAAIGGAAVSVPADVTSRESIEAMVTHVIGRFGRIDVLVNNAGWDRTSLFVVSDPADWDRIIAINLYGVLNTCKAVLPILAAQGHGSVVNLGSDAGRVGASGGAVNSAAKGGVIAFTKSLAREVARNGINVNCVCPGPTDTPMLQSRPDKLKEAFIRAIPFRRFAKPQEIADAILFFASARSDYVTGQVLSVSGGLTFAG